MTTQKKRTITFGETPPKHVKKPKKDRHYNSSDEEDAEDKKSDKRIYERQLRENLKHEKDQKEAAKKHMSDEDWKDLDSKKGPKKNYDHSLNLQTGPELEAYFNALNNRGNKSPITTKRGIIKGLAVWGGKTKKNIKTRKYKK